MVDPALLSPCLQRKRCVDLEIIERRITPLGRELGLGEPFGREFVSAVGHVLASEHAKLEHSARRQLRPEQRREIPANRLAAPVFNLAASCR